MNNQEPDLNPTPAETDSAKTNESVQREGSELPVDQRSSYLRSRQIALKSSALKVGTLAEAPKRALGAFLPHPCPAGSCPKRRRPPWWPRSPLRPRRIRRSPRRSPIARRWVRPLARGSPKAHRPFLGRDPPRLDAGHRLQLGKEPYTSGHDSDPRVPFTKSGSLKNGSASA